MVNKNEKYVLRMQNVSLYLTLFTTFVSNNNQKIKRVVHLYLILCLKNKLQYCYVHGVYKKKLQCSVVRLSLYILINLI